MAGFEEAKHILEEGKKGVAMDVDVWQTPFDVVHDDSLFRLIRYRNDEKPEGTPVLLIPSLTSRPYILDLQPDVSVVRRLLERRFRVYMVDWGYPLKIHRFIDIVDYIDYIDFCVDTIRNETGANQVTLHGYCLGGTLSVIYAALEPSRIRNLVIQAAPIDFDNDAPITRWAKSRDPDRIAEPGNAAPSFFNLGFRSRDPLDRGGFSGLGPEFLKNYFRVERWLHDCPNIPDAAYKRLIREWYRENRLIRSEFKIFNRCVDLARIDMPIFLIAGEKDPLSPPSACLPLLEKISSSDSGQMILNRGHIGLSISRRAHQDLWPKVCRWLEERSERKPVPE